MPQFNPFILIAWNLIPTMGFHLHVPFFFLLHTCWFYNLILISTVAKLRRMQVQISNIISRINKYNERGYTYSFKVRHFKYVINYSFRRNSRNLCNLQRKSQVTRKFATLVKCDVNQIQGCEGKIPNVIYILTKGKIALAL